MAIVITDETAAHQGLNVDSSRNYGFGTGTPTDRLTAGGVAVVGPSSVADSGSVDSTSLSPTSGSVSIRYSSGATVSTAATGRPPVVAFTRVRQAKFNSTDDPLVSCVMDTLTEPLFDCYDIGNGYFSLENNDQAKGAGPPNGTHQCSSDLQQTSTCSYVYV